EQNFTDRVERQPELLAHHLTAAGDTERAVGQWLKAGQYAAERLAYLEAIRHFERGLGMLQNLPEGPARDGLEIELQLARGLSLFTTKGFIVAEAALAYTRARELTELRGDARQRFAAVYGLWQSSVGTGMVVGAQRLSDQLLQLAIDSADDGLRLQAHHSAWTTCLFAGAPGAAREHIEAGRRLYDPKRHRSHRRLYGGHDPGACALYMGAQAYLLLGYPERGSALAEEALAFGRLIGHPFTLAAGLAFTAMFHLDRNEPGLALQRLQAAESLAAEQRLGLVLESQLLRGAILTAQGALDEAVACLRSALAGPPGSHRLRTFGLAGLATALTRQGKPEAALAALKEGGEEQEKTGQRRWEAELLRLQGIALLRLNRPEEAQSAFENALRIARKQQAKAYELRAATNLAQLWGERGKRQKALGLLTPIYGWFAEGFDTLDLKQARALLDELA
ncbi:MAG TPA: tetratricopeptide repeat protein, partial [Stellaceae bacterium]|nr:tetratricopeptide repeat protein [Stellaceae bacterium]